MPLINLKHAETFAEGLDHPEGVALGPDGKSSPAAKGVILSRRLRVTPRRDVCGHGWSQSGIRAGCVRQLSTCAPRAEMPFSR